MTCGTKDENGDVCGDTSICGKCDQADKISDLEEQLLHWQDEVLSNKKKIEDLKFALREIVTLTHQQLSTYAINQIAVKALEKK